MLPVQGLRDALSNLQARVTALEIAHEDSETFGSEERIKLLRALLSDGVTFSVKMISMAAAAISSGSAPTAEQSKQNCASFLDAVVDDIRETTAELVVGVPDSAAELLALLEKLRGLAAQMEREEQKDGSAET